MYASPANEHWYVGAENHGKSAILLGPYPNHSEATKHIDKVRAHVRALYPHDIYATFATFGVARVISDNPLPGRFNDALGYVNA